MLLASEKKHQGLFITQHPQQLNFINTAESILPVY